MTKEKTPFLIGLHAARANFIPGLIIQAVMVAVVVGYYFHPGTRAVLETLAGLKQRGGYFFSAAASMIAGGLLPMILTVLVLQRGKILPGNGRELAFLVVFWGVEGTVVDCFYRFQSDWFGNAVNVATITKKVLVDQFLYNPLLAAPFGLLCYEWKNQGYKTAGMSRAFTPAFYKNKTLPALVATWGVWFPVVALVYSLPPLLQIPLFCLALTFWVMIFAYITSHHRTMAALPAGKLN